MSDVLKYHTSLPLAQELLIPAANTGDGIRLHMFYQHGEQTTTLVNPENPLTFSGYEKRVGSVTSGIVKKEGKVLLSTEKFLVTEIELGNGRFKIDIFEKFEVNHFSETNGNYNIFKEVEVGEVLPKDTVVARTNQYDEDLNLLNGVNLRTAQMSYKNNTYEDSLVLSETAAKERLKFTKIFKIQITLNTNDILLNNFGVAGDAENYQPIPLRGVNYKNGVISRRRIIYSDINSYSDESLSKFNFEDTNFNFAGRLSNVEVYFNGIESTLDTPQFKRIKEEYLYKKELYINLLDLLTPYYEQNELYEFSEEASLIYRRCFNHVNGKWTFEKSQFDHMVIDLTFVEESCAVVGSKVTNR
jgi:hypothetical protein